MTDTATWVLLRQRCYADLCGWSRSLLREMLDVYAIDTSPLPLDLRELAHLCARSGREATPSVMAMHMRPLLESGLVEETGAGYVPLFRPCGTPQIRMAGARRRKARTESCGTARNSAEQRGTARNSAEPAPSSDADLGPLNSHQTIPDHTPPTSPERAPARVAPAVPGSAAPEPEATGLPPPDRPPQVPEAIWSAYGRAKAASRSPWTMGEDEALARLVATTGDDALLAAACLDLAAKTATGPPQAGLIRLLSGYANTQRRIQAREAERGEQRRASGAGGRGGAHVGRWDDFVKPDPDQQDDPILGEVEF